MADTQNEFELHFDFHSRLGIAAPLMADSDTDGLRHDVGLTFNLESSALRRATVCIGNQYCGPASFFQAMRRGESFLSRQFIRFWLGYFTYNVDSSDGLVTRNTGFPVRVDSLGEDWVRRTVEDPVSGLVSTTRFGRMRAGYYRIPYARSLCLTKYAFWLEMQG